MPEDGDYSPLSIHLLGVLLHGLSWLLSLMCEVLQLWQEEGSV